MRTTRINNWFESFGRFQIKHRVAFIVVLAVFTIVGCLGLQRLKLSNGEEDWFEVFNPFEAGTYGAFKDLSCVRLGATYSF